MEQQKRSREEVLAALHRSLTGAPSFIVVRGNLLVNMNGLETHLPKEGKRWRRHGEFKALYVGDDFALVEHVTLGGAKMPIFIPPKKRMAASNGRFVCCEVNYSSFVDALDANTLIQRRNRIEFGYSFLFDPTRRCWSITLGVYGNLVNVFPSDDLKKCWVIQVPRTNKVEYLSGDDLEQRAFSVAIGYSQQRIS